MSDAFTASEKTRLRRAHLRGHYDKETVYAVLDASMLCHVGYNIDGEPYVTPTIHWRDDDRLYWHGSSASRMIRSVEGGAPVCLTVSFLDGLVLARSGFHCSVNYRSAMAFGHARAVTDEAHRLAALKDFIDKMMPGRWDDMRPPNEQEMKATTVVYMDIEEASAKIRTGPPIDDEEDYALSCWAGVLPIEQHIGQPIADPKLAAGTPEPDYLRAFKLLDGGGD